MKNPKVYTRKNKTPKLSEVKLSKVTSSNIAEMGYEKTLNTLIVKFHSGDIWAYTPVAKSTYSQLVEAESVGKAFNTLVKNNSQVVQVNITHTINK
jgi:hypothetical protein